MRYCLALGTLALFSLAACGARVVAPLDGPAPVQDGGGLDVVERPDVPRLDVPRDEDMVITRGVGSPCAGSGGLTQGSCASGEACITDDEGFPGGYCTRECDPATPCPRGSTCAETGSGAFCLRNCVRSSDCRVREGYECTPLPDGRTVCLPDRDPVGTRQGGPCYTTTPGPHQIAPLARRTFPGANLSASAERSDSNFEAEGNVVISPRTGAVAVAYIAIDGSGVFIGSSTSRDGATVLRQGAISDPERSLNSDPVLAYTRDGALHVVWLGYDQGAEPRRVRDMRVRIAESADDGQSWSMPRAIEPMGLCFALLCDKPWILAAPAPGGGEALYVGYVVFHTETDVEMVVQRSEDGGRTWSAPATVARTERIAGGPRLAPNLLTPTAAPDGALHLVHVGLDVSATSRASVTHRVLYHGSTDGGRTWTRSTVVSAPGESVVMGQPQIVVDGASIHVAYVAGDTRGAWNVILATSNDGGMSWRHRRVNDEPDDCATHYWPSLVADTITHRVHLTWLDNRFGDGIVAYAFCPNDPSVPCSPNEQVSDASFTFATARDPSRWHGDYQGLALTPSGELWAAWSDTRTGSPAMYMARGRAR